jgi:hypothetical protein
MSQDVRCVFYVVGAAVAAMPIAFVQLLRRFDATQHVLSAISIPILLASTVCALVALSISLRTNSPPNGVVPNYAKPIAFPCKVCIGSFAVGMSLLIASFVVAK